MDHETARALLHDLAARTLVAAYVEEPDGRTLTKVDPITGQRSPVSEPGEVVRAVLQWHGAGWAGEIAPGWHCFVDSQYLFIPGARADLSRAVDTALALVDEADEEHHQAMLAAHPAARTETSAEAENLHLGTVVVDVKDMERAVSFWSAALGYQPRGSRLDPYCMVLVDPAGKGVPLSLQTAPEPGKEVMRLNLDLYTSNQAGQVARLVELGASEVWDWPYPEDADFVVLRDPDGNEFCVIDHAQR